MGEDVDRVGVDEELVVATIRKLIICCAETREFYIFCCRASVCC